MESPESCRTLADKYDISPTTAAKWKKRDDPYDLSCRPNNINYSFNSDEEAFILFIRKNRKLPLDDLFETISDVIPEATRSSVYRCIRRAGLNRLCEKQAKDKPGEFRDYEPGYLHIDCFYLPKIDGSRKYCFVAVDRATRAVYLYVYDKPDKQSAVNFLGRCLSFFPFRIKKILTDNGREFTLSNWGRWGKPAKGIHFFDEVCIACGIEHRLTKPYTPKTNGLVERMNGLIQEQTIKRHKYPGYTQIVDALYWWMVYYNTRRKNRQIGRKTPLESMMDWYEKQPDLFIKEPNHLWASLSTMR